MKRREFLKLASASMALAAVPLAVADKYNWNVLDHPLFDPAKIEWGEQPYNWGRSYAVFGAYTFNGVEYRQAVQLRVPKKDTTPEDIAKVKELIVQSLKTTIKRSLL